MRLLDPLLKVNYSDRNFFEIILWWEIRRLLYNFIVLVAGILSLVIMTKAASLRVKLEPGEDFFEPIMIPVFAVVCNLGYTLGWITELFMKKSITYGPKMFIRGLYFTLFWIFLPTTIWVIIAFFDLAKKLI